MFMCVEEHPLLTLLHQYLLHTLSVPDCCGTQFLIEAPNQQPSALANASTAFTCRCNLLERSGLAALVQIQGDKLRQLFGQDIEQLPDMAGLKRLVAREDAGNLRAAMHPFRWYCAAFLRPQDESVQSMSSPGAIF